MPARRRELRRFAAAALAAALLLLGSCGPRPEPPAPAGPGGAPTLRERLDAMTLREKVGQLFFVRPDALDLSKTAAEIRGDDPRPVTALTDELRRTLEDYPVGGVVLFGKNIESPGQLRRLTAALRQAAPTPLLLGVDEEGGAVARLAGHGAFRLPRYESAAAVGAAGESAAREMGRTIGGYLRDYGFTMDFAPVADVNTNPQNPVIGRRAFSSEAETAAVMAGAMAAGLSEAGIVPVYKHFPGHGDTAEDSHLAVAVTGKTLDELERCEWLPYVRNDLTAAGVMVGHIAAPAVTGDDTPASLSPILVTGCLRGRLGFDGLVITDSLAMDAIRLGYEPGEAAVLALEAGCDMLLMPDDLPAAFDAVLAAAESGRLTEARLDESVERILRYKQIAGLL